MASLTRLICLLTYLFAERIVAGNGFRCGRRSVAFRERITGGFVAKQGSWPWIVSISYGDPYTTKDGTTDGHLCGGSLIGLQWVLTAAHCLDLPGRRNVFPGTVPQQWRVTAGILNRTREEEQKGNWQASAVKRFIYHRKFKDYDLYSIHDVALLQLAQPFKVTDYVRPICLPRKRPQLSQSEKENSCYVAGWGTTSANSTKYSLTLQEVPMRIASQSFCKRAYTTPATYRIHQHICGGYRREGSKDACKGDSGGPLACRGTNGSWYVAGIVSFGKGCGNAQYPGVYTNVRTYQEWILKMVARYSVKLPIVNASKKSAGRRRRSLVN